MRTVSYNLLEFEKTKLYENISAAIKNAGAVDQEEYDRSFYLLDKFVPYETNDMYDICIYYKNNIYLIRFAVTKESKTHFENEEEFAEYVKRYTAVFAKKTDLPEFVKIAEEYGAKACLMLIGVNDMQPLKFVVGNKKQKDGKLYRNGHVYRLGLVDAHSLEPIDLIRAKYAQDKPMTDWEKRIFCINFVCEQIKDEHDGKVVSVDDSKGAEPQIWFRNESGELCWVKIEYSIDDTEQDDPVHVPSVVKDNSPGMGYTARIGFAYEPMRSNHINGGKWKYDELKPVR